MAHTKIYREAQEKLRASCHYSRKYWQDWDYDHLSLIRTLKKSTKRDKGFTYNDVIIGADTESSKDHKPKNRKDICENHLVIWTVTIRAYHTNLVTLYGRNPMDFPKCIQKIMDHMEGTRTILFIHNLGWDWTFLRRFIMAEYGTPKNQLNVKPYYPLFIEFANGLMIRDSLILAQRKLEKWADDLEVEHRKASGTWDYDKIRHQNTKLSKTDLTYAEYDTLALVECIDATMEALHCKIHSLPYTNTGIVRNETKRRGKKHKAHAHYLKVVPSWESQQKNEMLYHGGFTHANRYIINWINEAECRDFASEYPSKILLEKFPGHAFNKFDDEITKDEVLEMADKYAMKFLFCAKGVRLKNKRSPMPSIQSYKCLRKEGAVFDNGRIISANYIAIWWCEIDLQIFDELYTCDESWISNLEYSAKEYLPRWFTDLVYELFKDKTMLKGGDPVNYQIKKAMLNSTYGMTVQKPVKVDIKENYVTDDPRDVYKESEDFNEAEEYEKHIKRYSSILPYEWGCWITAMAMHDIFELSKCIADDGIWLYTDTDSIYATKWDEDKLNEYNRKQIDKLHQRGYEGITFEGKTYYPGVAEFDGVYSEFKTCGAKRYACRYADDKRNKEKDRGYLKLTVAGVPKKKGADCLKDDINNFRPGFIFDGDITGKTQHTHFYSEIHTDKHGNLIGDSIDLSPCDYKLDDIFNNAKRIEEIQDPDYEEEVLIQIFEED